MMKANKNGNKTFSADVEPSCYLFRFLSAENIC